MISFCILFFNRWRKARVKTSQRWAVVKLKVKKTYPHFRLLKMEALKLQKTKTIAKKVVLADDDPRRICHTVHGAGAPSTATLVAERVSRFKTQPLQTND